MQSFMSVVSNVRVGPVANAGHGWGSCTVVRVSNYLVISYSKAHLSYILDDRVLTVVPMAQGCVCLLRCIVAKRYVVGGRR